MPFVEAAIIAAEIAAEEAAAAAAAEAAAAAAAEATAAGATEAAAAAAAETVATDVATTAAANTVGTVAETSAQGILEAVPEAISQEGATAIADAAPELTQTAAEQASSATQAAAEDIAQGTAQQPAGLEQIAPQPPAGVEPTAPVESTAPAEPAPTEPAAPAEPAAPQAESQPQGLEQIQPQDKAQEMTDQLQKFYDEAANRGTNVDMSQSTADASKSVTDAPVQSSAEPQNLNKPEVTTETTPKQEGTMRGLNPQSNIGAQPPSTTTTPPGETTTNYLTQQPSASTQTPSELGKGVGKSPFEQGLDKAMKYLPLGIMTAGVAGSFSQGRNGQQMPSSSYSGPLNKYKLSSNFQASSSAPNVYKPKYAAEGGIMQAGPVEQMAQNAIGDNRMYPQGQQVHTQFATPTQMPASAEIVRSDYDQKTNPYTGQEVTMASGGKTKSGFDQDTYDYYASMLYGQKSTPESGRGDPGIYRDTDPSTRTKSALDATKIRLGKIMGSANMPDQHAHIPSGNLGIIDVGPANVKSKQSEKDDDEFAAGGIAQVKKYADGGKPADSKSAVTPAPSLDDYAASAPSSMAYLSSQNPAVLSQLAGMAPLTGSASAASGTPATPTPFQYAPIVRTGADVQSYAMQHPITDQVYAAKKAAEEAAAAEAARQAAMNGEGGGPTAYDQWSSPGGGKAGGSVHNGIIGHAAGGEAKYNLGGYSDGGRLLRGPGDGMSDNIPASIGDKQPARLADGEFVFPADVVSALGNGSTEAGARHLYSMMDKIRKEAHGKTSQQKKVNPKKVMPK